LQVLQYERGRRFDGINRQALIRIIIAFNFRQSNISFALINDTFKEGVNVAVVNQDGGTWSNTPEIVEVSEDNIVTLFTPRGHTSSSAWCVNVHCDDLEITNIPQGSCPLRIKVLKRYGTDVQLGEITKWEDRQASLD
jgi:hypothetical protein